MNGRVLGALLVAGAAGVTILSCSYQPQEAVKAQLAAQAQQWEYRIVGPMPPTANVVQQAFNKLGADGWEHSGIAVEGHGLIVFNRPKR
jgi:hypothetical protein